MNYISLETILSRGEKVSPRVLYKLLHPLVEQLIEMRDSGDAMKNGQLTAKSIVFTPDYNSVEVFSASDNEQQNIKDWGDIIFKVIDRVGYNDKRLKIIAGDCMAGNIDSLEELHLQLERRINRSIYKLIIAIVLLGLAIMAIMHFLQ